MFIKETPENEQGSIFTTKLTGSGVFIIGLLVLSLIALGERILYDMGRFLAPAPLDYFNNLGVILVHAFFIIPLLVISIIVNVSISTHKQRYAVVLIPYYVFTIIMALQLALEYGVYFSQHHTVIEFYIVMTVFVAVCTYGIYYIQSKYKPQV
ncbi:MAG: hypothetical protein KW788_00590 [Candidatus Doudnabacteria bacterium]|nr:hypothetical protein [Candidatus Doudnabacteria bacterium]